jgi:eukaryotic-like serine/threonine-protein kinase
VVIASCGSVGVPEDVARQLFSDVASAVAFLHRAGMVHRDMKPENVQVLPSGRAKLLDYGFGKCLPFQVSFGVGDAGT